MLFCHCWLNPWLNPWSTPPWAWGRNCEKTLTLGLCCWFCWLIPPIPGWACWNWFWGNWALEPRIQLAITSDNNRSRSILVKHPKYRYILLIYRLDKFKSWSDETGVGFGSQPVVTIEALKKTWKTERTKTLKRRILEGKILSPATAVGCLYYWHSRSYYSRSQ